MIVVKIELHSAVTHDVSNLGTLVIDNTGGTRTRANYRCRMYQKSKRPLYEQIASERPFRESVVMDHAKQAEPVANLVAKALKNLGYR